MIKKLTKVLVYVENGTVWPIIKVCDHEQVEVIVVNNDQHIVWKPKVEYDCDREINDMSILADNLKIDLAQLMPHRVEKK